MSLNSAGIVTVTLDPGLEMDGLVLESAQRAQPLQ
jgi:hypothetical protein